MTTVTEALVSVLNYYVPENMIPYPNELDNSWYFNGPNLVITANTTVSPDGSTTADTVDDQDGVAASALFIPNQAIAADSTLRHAILYLKQGTASETRVLVQLTGGPSVINDVTIDWTASPPAATFNDGSGTFEEDENGFYKLVMPLQNANSTQITFAMYAAGETGSATGSVITWGWSISTETGICDKRIYNLVMADASNKPTAVVQKAAQTRVNTMSDSGGSGVENARSRITIYAKTISEAETQQEYCRKALMETEALKATPLMNLDDFDDGTKLYQVIVDYSIWYRH